MRSWIIAACIAGQLAVLAYMVFGRELVIHRGAKVSIATAPIDPRDPFRGDFVRLRYPLNALSYAPVRWQPADYQPRKGDRMYAILEQRSSGLHDVAYFSNLPPDSDSESLYLRGRIQGPVSWNGRDRVVVNYGIEQLFVEQGSGLDIETRRGIRGGMQNAMHASIAIGADGSAVLTGYTWSSIAIGLEITDSFPLTAPTPEVDDDSADITEEEPGGPEQQQLKTGSDPAVATQPPIKLTITNVSDEAITLNNPGDNCGFKIEPVTRSNSQFFQPLDICANLPITPVALSAGESMILDINLADPRWHMSQKVGEVIHTGDIRSFQDSREWFRLVYRSESQAQTASDDEPGQSQAATTTRESNTGAAPLWQGDIVSQAFSARGQID